jgi:hypothetical protein
LSSIIFHHLLLACIISTFADYEDNFHFARSGCATGGIYIELNFITRAYVAYYYWFKLLILVCASIIHLINAQLSFLIWFADSSYCVPPHFSLDIMCVCNCAYVFFDIQIIYMLAESIQAREGQKQSYI